MPPDCCPLPPCGGGLGRGVIQAPVLAWVAPPHVEHRRPHGGCRRPFLAASSAAARLPSDGHRRACPAPRSSPLARYRCSPPGPTPVQAGRGLAALSGSVL